PSTPQLLEMMVRLRVPRLWMALIRFSGFPHSPNPPDMTEAPSRRSARAASAEGNVLSMVREFYPRPWRRPTAGAILEKVGIVTFTTDFGYVDGYAGAMKGVVLGIAPGATLVDITHGISPQDVTGGAVVLAQAAPTFPPGTIHVAVVDPGVGTGRA